MPEAAKLQLSIEKAARQLDWHPVWGFESSVARTAQWYHQRHELGVADMRSFSLGQIRDYAEAAREVGLCWATDE